VASAAFLARVKAKETLPNSDLKTMSSSHAMLDSGCGSAAHLSRRTILRSGAAFWLTPLATRLARAAESTPGRRPRSLIVVWLDGGPSQLESFDPHPGSPIGGTVKGLATSARDIVIADTLPRTAEQMHRIALVRSMTSKEGDHERAIYNIKTGYRPDPTVIHPSIGAIVCHQLQGGADIPRHMSILPTQWPGRGGYLGARYDAFIVPDPGSPIPDVTARVDPTRLQRRLDNLLSVMEPEFARQRLVNVDDQRTLHMAATQAAMRMMDSEQLKAFDVRQESSDIQSRFGDSAEGRACLAAIRLIEAGVRCVEVNFGGWDSHINNDSLQRSACQRLDGPLAALIETLAERELLDDTLVVCGGEFGRTPNINPAGGRDHWPHGFSMALAGCGIRGGAVHGETNPDPPKDAENPVALVKDPVTVADLHATMLTALGIPYDLELMTPVQRPLKIGEGQPLRHLFV
jgi:hypothetical protein